MACTTMGRSYSQVTGEVVTLLGGGRLDDEADKCAVGGEEGRTDARAGRTDARPGRVGRGVRGVCHESAASLGCFVSEAALSAALVTNRPGGGSICVDCRGLPQRRRQASRWTV